MVKPYRVQGIVFLDQKQLNNIYPVIVMVALIDNKNGIWLVRLGSDQVDGALLVSDVDLQILIIPHVYSREVILAIELLFHRKIVENLILDVPGVVEHLSVLLLFPDDKLFIRRTRNKCVDFR